MYFHPVIGIDKYQLHQKKKKNRASSDPMDKLNDIQNRHMREGWELFEEGYIILM